MKTKFEILTENQKVENLGPDDLIIHARHMFLGAAKDLCKPNQHPDDQFMGENAVNVVLGLQMALEAFGPNHV